MIVPQALKKKKKTVVSGGRFCFFSGKKKGGKTNLKKPKKNRCGNIFSVFSFNFLTFARNWVYQRGPGGFPLAGII